MTEWPDIAKQSEDLNLDSGIIEEAGKDDSQQLAFTYIPEIKETWKQEWQGMPEFIHEDSRPWKTIAVHFESREDMDIFSKLIKQQVTFQTRSTWYPPAEIGNFANKRYGDFDES